MARGYLMLENYDRVQAIVDAQSQATRNANLTDIEQRLLSELRQTATQANQRRQQAQAVVLRRAAEQVQQKQFDAALVSLQSVQVESLTSAWLWRYRVLQAQSFVGTNRSEDALAQLDQIDAKNLDTTERVAIAMVALDAAINAGKLGRAQSEIESLQRLSGQLTARDDMLGPTIALRAAELALLKKDRETVDRLVSEARQAYPEYVNRHEFDLLEARNALARIEFDRARRILQSIIATPPASDNTAVPRAYWLLGESYFLSQDAARAAAAYTQVIDHTVVTQWTESALMQRGKCHELLGNNPAAIADYQRLMRTYPRSSLLPQARERLSELGIDPNAEAPLNAATKPSTNTANESGINR